MGASESSTSPKVSVDTIMDGIPMATDKHFPSTRALGVITADPESVSNAKDEYKRKSSDGTLTLYKQKITNMDRMTLRKAVEVIQRDWDVDVKGLRAFKMFVESTTKEWSYDDNVVEELEPNSERTQFIFFHVIFKDGKYSMAICHLKSNTPLDSEVLIAGLMKEGFLGKDEDKRLYLQF